MVRKISVIGPAIVFLSPVLPLLLYFQGDFSHLSDPFSLSMLFGIPSYIYLLNSVILAARLKFIDKLMGHDRVIVLHRFAAVAGILMGLTHWIIKSRVFPFYGLQNWLGLTAVCLFFLFSLGAFIFMAPGKLIKITIIKKINKGLSSRPWGDYSIMKSLHNILITAILIISIHVLLASSTSATWWRTGLMGLWAAAALLLWIFHKLLRPVFLKKREITVSENLCLTEQENTQLIREIRMEKGKFPLYEAGQFVFIRFPDHKDLNEEHPYTLSSSPSDNYLAVTAKELGDFSSRLEKVSPNNRALLDGPYGQFTLNSKKQKPLVFLAGGIGITPFLSIIKEYSDSWEKPITLFWAVQSSGDLVYHKTFSRLAKERNLFTYIPVISSAKESTPDFPYESGYLTPEIIKNRIPRTIDESDFYFCGPGPMFNALIPALKKNGIKKIHFERFSF